uniref:CARD domain-containing protein n=1 Tax=Gadus morhua TaxID=8049 RepID=A0A8C5BXB1_GADMO
MSPAAGEGTSDLQSSPHHTVAHPAEQATSSNTSSPPATSSEAKTAEGELRRIRSEFVKRVSIPVVKCLLDDLWQQKVFSTEEKESVMEDQNIRADRARCLIDLVIPKGERASQAMIDNMKLMDNHLCITLGL